MSSPPPILLPTPILPSGKEVYFEDSTFFERHGRAKLPTPADIRAAKPPGDRLPVRFPALGLLVKYGMNVRIAEGQCLWAIRHLFQDSVPVPEIYAWQQDDGETFLYMELIEGETLEHMWPDLTPFERSRVCGELQGMVKALRTLRQAPDETFVGSIGGQDLSERIFEGIGVKAGPFLNVKVFNDWLQALPIRNYSAEAIAKMWPEPYRAMLLDDAPICFTHGDLHPSNIMLSKAADGRKVSVCALIDFEQAGWWPAYWEYCKAMYTAEPRGDWEKNYIPMFLEAWPACHEAWDFYAGSMGW